MIDIWFGRQIYGVASAICAVLHSHRRRPRWRGATALAGVHSQSAVEPAKERLCQGRADSPRPQGL